MPIHILSDEIASQIAAGEVIERPASVIKELLENALDAGARAITIRVENAGRKLIEVADDGAGIQQEELALAVARHATSKLRIADDLFHITTLGFRGEALASIASVARLTLTSRFKDAEIGGRLVVEGGRVGIMEAVGVPAGTVVRVEDLFYNVPARLKFLKQDYTERQQMDALVTRYALAYPQVRIHLFHDGKPVLQSNGNGNRREILAGLYGVEVGRQMLEVTQTEGEIKISGFTSPVALTRSNRREITFFVNGRWISDFSLNSALLQAYHTLLMVGRYPMAVLFIEMSPEEVDVNVHPAKAEVRFHHPDQLFSAVQRSVRRALLAYSPVPQITGGIGWHSLPQSSSRQIDPAWGMAGEIKPVDSSAQIDGNDIGEEKSEGMPSEQSLTPAHTLPLLRLVGQVGAAYLVAEGPDGLYLIDQHAAHERILFERFRSQSKGKIPSQALLEPAVLHLSPQQSHLLDSQLSILNDLGFEVEPFGQATYRVRSIPAFLTGIDPLAAVQVVVEDFEEDETPLQAEIDARLAARICKRVAVKAGKTLSVEEQKALIRDLENCTSPRTCPHGRPTMIHLSVDLLERQFGRRGSR